MADPAPAPDDSLARIQVQLDDIKSALYAVAERVGRASAMMELRSNEVAQAVETIKALKPADKLGGAGMGISGMEPPSSSTAVMERVLDKKLTPLAQLEAESLKQLVASGETHQAILLQLDKQTKEAQRLSDAVEALSQKIFALQSAATSADKAASLSPELLALQSLEERLKTTAGTAVNSVGEGVELRFIKLAELEAELLKQSRESKATLEEVKAMFSAETDSSKKAGHALDEMQSVLVAHAHEQAQAGASLAEMQKELKELSRQLVALEQAGEKPGASEAITAQLQALPPAFDKILDSKLTSLAQLEAELLKQSQETHAAIQELNSANNPTKAQGELVANSVAWISTEVKGIKGLLEQEHTLSTSEWAKLNDAMTAQSSESRTAFTAATKQVTQSLASLQQSMAGSELKDSLSRISVNQDASHASLQTIQASQQEQNLVLSDALTALLDATEGIQKRLAEASAELKSSTASDAETLSRISAALSSVSRQSAELSESFAQVKSRINALPDEATLAQHIEKEISRKLA